MPANNEVSLTITVNDQGSRTLTNTIKMLQSLERAVESTARSFDQIQRETKDLNESLRKSVESTKRFNTQLDETERGLRDVRRSTDRAGDAMLDYAVALSGVAAGLSRVRDFGTRQLTGFVQAAGRLENVTQAFTSVLGSATAANDAIDRLRRASQDPGLTFQVASRAAQRFISYGVAVEDAVAITRGFANAAVLSGTSTRELDEGLRQLAKSIGTGKIEQDDLNSITERFGPIAQRIRAEYGKTGQEVTAALNASGTSVAQFALELSRLDKQPKASADSLSNAISNLQNAVEELSAQFGEILLPVVKDAVNELTNLLNRFKELPQPVKEATVTAGVLGVGLTGVAAAALHFGSQIALISIALGRGSLSLIATLKQTSIVTKLSTASFRLSTGVLTAGIPVALAYTETIRQLSKAYVNLVNRIAPANEASALSRRVVEDHRVAIQRLTGTVDRNAETFKEFQTVVTDASMTLRAQLSEALREVEGQTKSATDQFKEFRDLILTVPAVPQFFTRDPSLRPTTPTESGVPAVEAPGRRPFISRDRQPFIPAPPPDLARGAPPPLDNLEEFHRRTTKLIRVNWTRTYDAIRKGFEDTGRSIQRTSTNITRAINTTLQAQINLNRLQLRDSVEASTRQFQALGDLDKLRFDSAQRGVDATNLLTNAQDQYTDSIQRSIQHFDYLQRSIQNLFASLSQGTRSGGQGVTGFARGFTQFTNFAIELSQIIAGTSRVFHNPGNDLLAENIAFRAASSFGLSRGNINAIRRQNARDFSESFARGAERAISATSGTGSGETIVIENYQIIDDRTIKGMTNVINRMEQSGRIRIRG